MGNKPMQRHGQPQRQDSRRSQDEPGTYPLPRDTCDLAKKHGSRCFNYGLRTERLLEWKKGNGWKLTEQAKKREGVRLFNGPLQGIVSAYQARWRAMLTDYRQRGYEMKDFCMHADSRVIVGLGAESVLETSVRLHRVYGFPIIPGSALKGLAKSYAELVETKNESDATFAAVFGKSPPNAAAGKVIFFDAVPADANSLKLELDVMNPHYSQYYQGNSPPADYLNPVPVFFLAIGRDSKFLFAVASKEATLAQQAQRWLQEGLKEMGVGAKTVAGYGVWRS